MDASRFAEHLKETPTTVIEIRPCGNGWKVLEAPDMGALSILSG
jgi:hypothetical protein